MVSSGTIAFNELIMKIKNRAALQAVRKELEDKRERERQGMVDSFQAITESLRPIQLVKRAFNKLQLPSSLAGNVVKAIAVVGIGFLSKKLLLGKSSGLIKKIGGLLIELGLADLLTKNAEAETPVPTAVEKNAAVEKEK